MTGTDGTHAGGLIGALSHEGGDVIIKNCYAAGDVSANSSGTNVDAGGITAQSYIQSGGTFVIQDCAALNRQISCSNTYGIGRVAGGSYGGDTLSGNIAYSGMTLNGATVNAGTADTGAGKNGESKTSAELKIRNTWTDLFGSSNFAGAWKWIDGYDYPVLNWQTARPTGVPSLP
jgi:hypothetical protein